MPLTPADIHNVAFKKPPIGKRGYDEEDVDAFLDRIEQEIIRLIEENEALRQGLARGSAIHDGDRPGSADLAELMELRSRLQQMMLEKADAERTRDLFHAELGQALAQGGPSCEGDGQVGQTARMLEMAQQTADGHIDDARREADKLIGQALQQAQALVQQAQASAQQSDEAARQRHQDAIRSLENERSVLQQRIKELSGFGRDYQQLLRTEVTTRMQNMKDISRMGPVPVFDDQAWLRHYRGSSNLSGVELPAVASGGGSAGA
ncbi:DivIVA domain-containing protein [Micromonospora sp. NPDC023814]|uniref:DivIVA domain-containing protein n=1 Tax=Micromonospora sp. NPDC023814 TaxID=3154596 RepID=UPI0033E7AC9D